MRKLWHEKRECERKLLEHEALLYHAKENEKKLKEENGAQRDFYKELLVQLTHQIRNPLNGVSGLSALLEETSLTGEQYEYIQSIRNCGKMW